MRNNKGQFTNMREDVTGQKFNHLTALSFSHKDKNRKTYWDFLCDYEPNNCRWVTHKVNANNRKRKYVNSEENNQIA